MIKKRLLFTALGIGVTGAIIGGATGAYYANLNSNPYQYYSSTPISSSNSDMIQTYFAAAVNGTRLMLLPGYIHTAPLTQALAITPQQNEFIYKYMNKSGFVLLDDSYGMPVFSNNKLNSLVPQPIWSTHVASVQFRTDLGSFLTGIAAGEFLNEYQYYFAPNPNDELTWATYGGATFSSVTGYMGGLQRGIAWFNKHIAPYAKTEDGKPYKPIKQVFVTNSMNGNFVNSFAPTGGNALITQFIDKKVDLLVPVAGPQTQQAVRLIKQYNSRTVVLGVDSACEDDTNSNLPLSTPGSQMVNGSKKIGGTDRIIQFSSMKRLDIADDLVMQHINDGITLPTKKDDTVGGFGYQSLGTADNGCVGVSDAGYQYFIRAIQMYVATNNGDINSPQHDVSEANIQKIFAIPNDNPETNIPGTKAYEDYWTFDKYNKYVNFVKETPEFKSLNDPSKKIYYTYNGWENGAPPPNGDCQWSYADLPNQGKPMMPLDESKLDQWYKDYDRINPADDGTDKPLTTADQERLASLHEWFKQNANEINERKDFNLQNVLTAENYDKNASLIKVIVSTPGTPLLDKSFSQSAYMGLVMYWKSKKINLPVPAK